MRPIVVDASVAAKWFLPEEGSGAARNLLSGKKVLAAPDLLRAEFGNILWKLQTRGILSKDRSGGILEDFLQMPVEIYPHEGLVGPAFEIATQTGRTVYDSLYVALAAALQGVVVTADRHLVNGLGGSEYAGYVRLLEKK